MEREENVTPAKEQALSEPLLGKFKNVDALVRAYGELEAEFTRRSQRLKAFEEASKEQEGAPALQKCSEDTSSEKAQAPSAPLASLDEAQKSEQLYSEVMQNEGVKARVLSDYLSALKSVPQLLSTGTGVVAPVSRPKSIAEAGNLALGYFKSNQ